MKEEIIVRKINEVDNKLNIERDEEFITTNTKQYTFYITSNKNDDFYFFKLDLDKQRRKVYTNKSFLFNSSECKCNTCEIRLDDDDKYKFMCDNFEELYLEYVDDKTNEELVDKYSHKLDEVYDFLASNYEEIAKKCLDIINKELSLN